MNRPEVTDISLPVQLLRNNGESGCLLQVQTCRRNQVSRGKKVGHFCTDVKIHSTQNLVEVPIYETCD
jgi:hypothetical protein